MRDLLTSWIIILAGIFMLSFGADGHQWYHWGSLTSGIVTIVFGVIIFITD